MISGLMEQNERLSNIWITFVKQMISGLMEQSEGLSNIWKICRNFKDKIGEDKHINQISWKEDDAHSQFWFSLRWKTYNYGKWK